MCGRITFKMTPAELQTRFDVVGGLDHIKEWSPRYNIGPTTSVVCVRDTGAGREAFTARWGLIPAAASGAKPTGSFNAKSERLTTDPLFQAAFQNRRCVVVATGFYEWQFLSSNDSQPYYITLRTGEPMAMAGIWESWQSPDGNVIETCAICTTTSNSMMERIFDRMPVILPKTSVGQWLTTSKDDVSSLVPLLSPLPSDDLQAWPVCKDVGNVASQGVYLTKSIF